MLRVLVRGWLPAISAGALVASSSRPDVTATLILLWAGAAAVRIAGVRRWSLLPQVMLALALISPEDGILNLALALVATGIVIAIRPARRTMAAVNLTSGCIALTLATLIPTGLETSLEGGSVSWSEGLIMIGIAGGWFLLDTILWTSREEQVRVVYRDAFIRLMSDSRVAVIIVSATLAFAALWYHSPFWATVTAGLPLFIAARLADQVRRHRTLVDLTIQALGRLPEAAGVSQRGHSKNVTSLAVAMGRAGGMAGREMETLRRAALLHDVGLLAATTPEVGRDGFVSGDVSAWGADIISTNDEFRRETMAIREMSLPYRTPGSDPIACGIAQIVRVACRAISMLEVDPVDQVVEALYAESIYTYDPQTIALIRPAVQLLQWPALPELG